MAVTAVGTAQWPIADGPARSAPLAPGLSRPRSEPPRRWVPAELHAHFSLRAFLALVVRHRAIGSLDAHPSFRTPLALIVKHLAAGSLGAHPSLRALLALVVRHRAAGWLLGAHHSFRALLALVVRHPARGELDAHPPHRALCLALVVKHCAAGVVAREELDAHHSLHALLALVVTHLAAGWILGAHHSRRTLLALIVDGVRVQHVAQQRAERAARLQEVPFLRSARDSHTNLQRGNREWGISARSARSSSALQQASGPDSREPCEPFAAFERRLGAAGVASERLHIDWSSKHVVEGERHLHALVARKLAASGQPQQARGGQGQGGAVASIAHGVGNEQLQLLWQCAQ
eukprot:scaffold20167_cov56-Phaeocystis_antarctica.AAC.4